MLFHTHRGEKTSTVPPELRKKHHSFSLTRKTPVLSAGTQKQHAPSQAFEKAFQPRTFLSYQNGIGAILRHSF